jgi:hypothetical protein
MANYSPLTKILMDDSVNRTNSIKSKSLFHSSSWIFQSKGAKKEIPQEDTRKSVGLMKSNVFTKSIWKVTTKIFQSIAKIETNTYLKQKNDI